MTQPLSPEELEALSQRLAAEAPPVSQDLINFIAGPLGTHQKRMQLILTRNIPTTAQAAIILRELAQAGYDLNDSVFGFLTGRSMSEFVEPPE